VPFFVGGMELSLWGGGGRGGPGLKPQGKPSSVSPGRIQNWKCVFGRGVLMKTPGRKDALGKRGFLKLFRCSGSYKEGEKILVP